jgi:hypothetical protein
MTLDDFRAQALAMLVEAKQIGGDEVASRTAQATSEDYWRELSPGESIGAELRGGTEAALDAAAAASFRDRGFCHAQSVVQPDVAAELAGVVRAIKAEGWPVVFALVYDRFWELALTDVRRIVEDLAGRRAFMRPHVAVHHVDATPGAAGWSPHPDGIGKPGRISSWVPLTEATLDNGCMYAIALNERTGEAVARYSSKELTSEDAALLLQHARALPASPGSMLAWNFDVIHWGSVSQGATQPRISVAFEWIQEDVPPDSDDLPLIGSEERLPDFTFRLKMIGSAIRSYWQFDEKMLPFVKLAEKL